MFQIKACEFQQLDIIGEKIKKGSIFEKLDNRYVQEESNDRSRWENRKWVKPEKNL